MVSWPDVLQLEVIKLQTSDLLTDKSKEVLVAVYKFLLKEEFPSLRHFS